jgi:hypothetical protein
MPLLDLPRLLIRKAADDDDFEIVPQVPEDDGVEWDVEDEDQDEVKRKYVQGMLAFLEQIRLQPY